MQTSVPLLQACNLAGDNASARLFAQALSEEELYHKSQGCYVPMFSYPPERPIVFIKFGDIQLQAEGDMQKLAFDWVTKEQQKTQCNICIPEVYKIFTIHGVTFIIMQLIKANLLRDEAVRLGPERWADCQSKYFDLIAEGIQLLRRIPVPDGIAPGPHTSGRRWIKHMLFKDQTAYVEYDSVQQLEDHLNRVAKYGYRNNPNPPVVNLEKNLVFCYTDFNDENFMFTTDANGRLRLYIIDFEHASFLPESFLAFVAFNPRWMTCGPIADRIGHTLPQNNLEVMGRICYMYQICVWGIEKMLAKK